MTWGCSRLDVRPIWHLLQLQLKSDANLFHVMVNNNCIFLPKNHLDHVFIYIFFTMHDIQGVPNQEILPHKNIDNEFKIQ